MELTSRPLLRPNWPLLYTAVAITTLATLLLELSLAWISTVIFGRSTLPLALAGLAAGALLALFLAGPLYRQLGGVSLLTAGLVVVVLFFFTAQHALYLAAVLPFAGAGFALVRAAAETVEHAERVYCFAFLGGAGGCLVLVLLFNTFGGPATVIAAAVLFASAAAIWFSLGGYKAGRIASVAAGLFLTMMVVANVKGRFVEVGRAHLAIPGDRGLTALFAVLLSAALGSLLSAAVLRADRRRFAAALGASAVLAIAVAPGTAQVTLFLIAPAGFLLGLALPAGTRLVRPAASA